MIKKLRRRFVITAVSAAAAVLLVIMGAVNIANYTRVVSDADTVLKMISDNGGYFPAQMAPQDRPDKRPDGAPGGQLQFPNDSPERPFDTRFFSVTLDEEGEALSVNTLNIAAVTDEQAVRYAQGVLAGSESGRVGDYRYKVTQTQDGYLVVFMDCARSLYSFRSFLAASLWISAAGILGVFLLVLLLSKKAIAPIAESYAKQKRFITDASHELKTPLTVINASAEVLEMTGGENEWTDCIKNQTEKLSRLTNDLVSLARMDEEGSRLRKTDFSLSDALSESLEPYAVVASAAGKTVQTDIQRGVSYRGDEEQIRKLICILADNAIKYSDDAGTIWVTLRGTQSEGLIVFRNTVDGCKKGNRDEYFERFYREDESRSAGEGYGIGLSIAQAIVTAHKGKITARSEDGKSVTITVTL